MIQRKIITDLEKTLKKLGLSAEKILVEHPVDPRHGDYATNLALQQQKPDPKKRWHSPKELASQIVKDFPQTDYLEKIEIAGAGFINFYLKDSFWQAQVGEILKQDKKYGASKVGQGKKVSIEYVSANPTGPLHFGNARGGPMGDVLASIFKLCGFKVTREYYHNDVGGQVERLGESIFNVLNGQKLEDQEYKGEYIRELAQKIGEAENAKKAEEKAVAILLKEILKDTADMGIKFNRIIAESELTKSSKTQEVLKKLQDKRVFKKQEGATWFAPRDDFLQDRESVVVKSDGSYTYFANDIAYHNLKFSENPDLVLDIFGANHHGHVPRLQAAISALGYDVARFQVILYQWVRFKRGSEIVKMSKRAGTFITVREILDEIGRDALRFFILMHDPQTHIDFDLDLAKKKSNENPVFYVQYAHARICSILGNLKIENLKIENLNLLSHSTELALIKKLCHFPELVEDISQNFQVHNLTSYAHQLADLFHKFYENCRVISPDRQLTATRVQLINATKIVLAQTLNLLGISAPTRM